MDGPVDGSMRPFWSESGPSRCENGHPDPDALTVLAVDDEPEVRSLYTAWFTPQHTVRTAATAKGALDRLDAAVDVVVMDRRLPDGSGDAVLTSLAARGFEGVRVVVVSACEPDLDVVDLPFDAYLTKPVDSETLLGVVDWVHRHDDRRPALAEYLVLDHKLRLLEASAVTVELESSPAFCRLRERRRAAKRRAQGRAEIRVGGESRSENAVGK
jgi:CheY-like chemotaxis protein